MPDAHAPSIAPASSLRLDSQALLAEIAAFFEREPALDSLVFFLRENEYRDDGLPDLSVATNLGCSDDCEPDDPDERLDLAHQRLCPDWAHSGSGCAIACSLFYWAQSAWLARPDALAAIAGIEFARPPRGPLLPALARQALPAFDNMPQ